MLVLLDATAIMSDPTCGGISWRVLANAASAWNVQVYVPEVVLIEAIAGYQRRVAEAAVGLTRWAGRHVGPLGLAEAHETFERGLADAASSYPARLRESLEALKATVLEPPEVAHLTLVERAASRRRPCDNQGDGYRDTLNWLTVVSLASQYPDQEIIWVSDNTQDFGTEDGSELHEDLVADLAAVGAENRVRWIRTLPDLVLTMATEHAPEAPADLLTIQARLRDEALTAFIDATVLEAAVGSSLDPRRCGLPTATTSAKILAVGEPNELRLTVRGAVADSEAVIQFDLEAETSIQIDLLPGTTAADIATPSTSVETAASLAQISKSLKFSGLITLDRYDRPIGGELTRITAKDDDAGLLQWAILDASNSFSDLRLPPGYFSKLLGQQPAFPPGYFSKLLGQQPAFPPGYLSKLLGQQPAFPPGYLSKLLGQQPAFPPGYLSKLLGQQPAFPPGYLSKLLGQQPAFPPGYLSKLLGKDWPVSTRDVRSPDDTQPSELPDSVESGPNDAGDQPLPGGSDPESDDDDKP